MPRGICSLPSKYVGKERCIIFFYCEAPREKAVPELRVSLPFGHLSFMILKEKKTVYFEVKRKSELSDPL